MFFFRKMIIFRLWYKCGYYFFFFLGGGGHHKRWWDDTVDAGSKCAYQEKIEYPLGSEIPCRNFSSLASLAPTQIIYLVSYKRTPIHDCLDLTDAYTCVYMYACTHVCACVRICFAIPPPPPSIEVDLAKLAPPPNIEKLPTPMYVTLEIKRSHP